MQSMTSPQPRQPTEYPRVRDLPARERPMNRLREAGPTAISTAEVLACLLHTPNALNQAQHLLVQFGSLSGLLHASETEITQVDGIGPVTVARLKAALECGRRLMQEGAGQRDGIRAPADAYNILAPGLMHQEQEHFCVVLLDVRNRVLDTVTLYVGSVNASHIRVAEVFREAVRRNAAAIIIAHNHPSGDPTPSPEDVEVTRQIKDAADIFDIELLDHIVIGRARFVSLRERGLGF